MILDKKGVIERYKYDNPTEQYEHIEEMESKGWGCVDDGYFMDFVKGIGFHYAEFAKYE